MSSTFNIEFKVHTTVTQELHVVKDGVTADEILARLHDGTYSTTIGHESLEKSVIIDSITGEEIAIILRQYSKGEFSGYEYANE